jgi:hypothetical protein
MQVAFNIALGLISFLGGWIIRIIWQGQEDQRKAHKELHDDVTQMKVLVAGEYMRRDEMRAMLDAVFAKLDRIYDKLETKVDK